VAAAHPSNVHLSTTAFNVVSPTPSYTVDGSKITSQKTTSQLNCRSSPLVPHPQANRSVVTPVRVSILQQFLQSYDVHDKQFLCEGFKNGFRLQYHGPWHQIFSANFKSVNDHEELVAVKLSKGINLGRIAGPFNVSPFLNLQCSPIGVVPNKEAGEFRLIHHLSHPYGSSINDFISEELCSVKYTTIDDAIQFMKSLGINCLLAKTDIASAFRIIQVHLEDHELVGVQFQGSFFSRNRIRW
jgi:hypothetical protein